MEAKENKLITAKTARYYTLGKDITKAERIWFACHGYGQLGKYFIQKFKSLDPDKNFVVVPEGLNRFYLEGFSGRVGATWMTKEARLDDIGDYINYLDTLHIALGLDEKVEGRELIHFGFSQGVATISRYIALGLFKPHRAVFWAGTFPPDLEPVDARESFKHLPVYTAVGDGDPFVNDDNRHRNDAFYTAAGIAPIHLDFEGKHDIPGEALNDLINLFH